MTGSAANALWDFYYRDGGPFGIKRDPFASVTPAHGVRERPINREHLLALVRQRIIEDEIGESGWPGERSRLAAAGYRLVIEGLAVPWGQVSREVRGTREKFRRGALTWGGGCTLKIFNHHGPAIADIASGTLNIWDGSDGLRFEAVLADTPGGRAAVAAARSAVGVSIGFRATARAHHGVSEVVAAQLSHIAIIEPPDMPAYAMTWVTARSEGSRQATGG